MRRVRRFLHHATNVGGDAIARFAISADHVHLYAAAVREAVGIVFVRQEQVPDAVRIALHRMGLAIPLVEVADECERFCAGRPFAIPDARLAVVRAAIEAEVVVALADFTKESAGAFKLLAGALVMGEALAQLRGVGLQVGILGDEAGPVVPQSNRGALGHGAFLGRLAGGKAMIPARGGARREGCNFSCVFTQSA